MRRLILMAGCLLVATPVMARAQGTTREVSGRVFDDTTGCPLRGVQIQASGSPVHAMTDANGRYHLMSPPAGSFTLTAMLRGYQARQSDTMTVADSAARVDFSLLRGAADSAARVAYPRHVCELEPPGT